MNYIVYNEHLMVTISSRGARVKSVIHKRDGVEHISNEDETDWGCHVPMLYPRIKTVNLRKKKSVDPEIISVQQNLDYLPEHRLVYEDKERIVFELLVVDTESTDYIYKFRFLSDFILDGCTLHHRVTVENLDDNDMPFIMGYHPFFAVPFDDKHDVADYEICIGNTDSRLRLNSFPAILLREDHHFMPNTWAIVSAGSNISGNENMVIANSSSQTFGIFEKMSGRGVVCNIVDFPYNLIWTREHESKFVCIESWHSLPYPDSCGIKQPLSSFCRPERCGQLF